MNFMNSTDTFGVPTSGLSGLMRSRSLGTMASAIGVIASAIVITAGYTVVTEESRGLMTRMRASTSMRRDRNTAVLCALLAAKTIPLDLIQHLKQFRDVFDAAVSMTADPEVKPEIRTALRDALSELYSPQRG